MNPRCSLQLFALSLLACLSPACAGDDYKLADYQDISSYFQKLSRASDRILLAEFGKTAMGKPMYIAYISAPENLKRLDHYRDISRRLALGEPDEFTARRLAAEGKAIVWIDSGLHASEVAPAQHSPELAYRMLTEGTIEEKIWELQQRKAALARDILGEGSFARTLTRGAGW